jgi:hypothetical protein
MPILTAQVLLWFVVINLPEVPIEPSVTVKMRYLMNSKGEGRFPSYSYIL